MDGDRWLDLGVGMVVVPGMEDIWDELSDAVEVVEVEPQTFWQRGESGWETHESSYSWLSTLRQPVIAHSVSYPVGGSVRPDPAGLDLTAKCVQRLGALHWSEHLSFNRTKLPAGPTPERDRGGGEHPNHQRGEVEGNCYESCFLLPPVQTWSTVASAVEAVGDFQASLDLRFLIETPVNYLRPRADDIEDGRFVAEIVNRTGCGILLDLHNVWANARNGRQPVFDYLHQLPLEAVVEVHLAGGEEHMGFYLDGHSGAVDEELLRIFEMALPSLPNLRAVIFEAMPDAARGLGVAGLKATLGDIRTAIERRRRRRRYSGAVAGRSLRERLAQSEHATLNSACLELEPHQRAETAEREADLVAFTTREDWYQSGTIMLEPADPGQILLRDLTDRARMSLITAAAPEEIVAVVRAFGADGARLIAEDYLRHNPAQLLFGNPSEDFAIWWRTYGTSCASSGQNCSLDMTPAESGPQREQGADDGRRN